MTFDPGKLLQAKTVNGWNLFWLVSLPMSLVMVAAMLDADMSTGAGVSSMIGFSVRWAVPFIFLVVAISSLQYLVPGPVPSWLLRNRKYIGLCFAVAMAWQGAFIFLMSNFFSDYYYEDVYLLRDELEGSVGYIFLAAMVVTSFPFGRKYLTPKQWRVLHKCGLYFLWAYPFSVYWWNLSYYPNPQSIDYVFYWSGFLAFALRILAWGRKRQQVAEGKPALALRLLGGGFVAAGVILASYGLRWQAPITAFLTGPDWSADLVLWLPFWPFEPFLSLFTIGLGATLITGPGAKVSSGDLAPRPAG